MLTFDMINQIKREMHYNPNFDTDDIIAEINLAIEHIETYTDASKAVWRKKCTNGVYDYLIDIPHMYRIVSAWYGQEDTSTLGDIREGYVKLEKLDKKLLGEGDIGYWVENEINTGVANDQYKKRIKLTFNPDTDYWVVIEYVPWDNIASSIFLVNSELDNYLPREIQSLIIERVVFRLKRSDGDQTFADHKADYIEKQERMENVHKEDVKFI